MSKKPIELKLSCDDDDVAYLYLPAHPKEHVAGLVKKQIRLLDIIDGYKGPDIYLDFDSKGELVGLEVT